MTKFVGEQPLANADLPARKLVEIANVTETAQDGRIFYRADQCTILEGRRNRINSAPPLIAPLRRGWLERHESGTYVKFTQAGAYLSA